MHITLHITTGCNMRCDYCYSPPIQRIDMTEEVAHKSVEYVANIDPGNTGIIFFGGEPLLKKDLIISTIETCKQLRAKYGFAYHFKVTTNGLLLDEPFLEYASSVGLIIALSIDGIREAHDQHRRTSAGKDTFDILQAKIDLLLRYQPYAIALMVVTPETVRYYAESVEYLFEKGFKYLVVSLDYAGNWTDADVQELRRQYVVLAKLYERLIFEQRKFYFSPFETKFATHIKGDDASCHRCLLGKRQISVGPDGTIYPCVQFVKDGVSNKEYSIGNVWSGIDDEKRELLFQLSLKRDEPCQKCALAARCNNSCSCLNWQTTGSINTISPVLCETERILIPIVDNLGEKLYSQRAPMFIQKHYNAVYPIISFLEDME